MQYTKQELIDTLRKQISINSLKAQNALLTIYEYQTEDEKIDGYTEDNNGLGFSGVDSEFLSSVAENYLKYGRLTEGQLNCLKRIMPKYSKQLIEHSIKMGKIVKVKKGCYEIAK